MPPEAWATVGVFVLGQIIVWVAILSSLRSDTKELRADLIEMKVEMKKLGEVVVQLARVDGRINMVEERQLLAGKRLDHLIQRFDAISSR